MTEVLEAPVEYPVPGPVAEGRVKWIAAFVEAQALMPNPSKSKTARVVTKEKGSYSYDYADLAEVVGVVRPILAAHGLAFTQPYYELDGFIHISTRIMHKAGHVEDFGESIKRAGATEQATGSIVTFTRRYALLSALGLAPADDDDAKSASDGHGDRPARVGGSSGSSSGGEDRGGSGKAEAVQPPLDAPGRKYLLAANKCPHVAGIDNDGRCMGCGKPLEAPLKEKA